jgi:hypothetical protein
LPLAAPTCSRSSSRRTATTAAAHSTQDLHMQRTHGHCQISHSSTTGAQILLQPTCGDRLRRPVMYACLSNQSGAVDNSVAVAMPSSTAAAHRLQAVQCMRLMQWTTLPKVNSKNSITVTTSKQSLLNAAPATASKCAPHLQRATS